MATEVVSRGRSPGRAGRDLALGAAIGYCASRVMDRATTWYRERQGEASRRREDEVAPGGGLVLAGRVLAGVVGRAVTDEEAGRIGLIVHRSLGVSYGIAAAALVRRGIGPLRLPPRGGLQVRVSVGRARGGVGSLGSGSAASAGGALLSSQHQVTLSGAKGACPDACSRAWSP